MPHFVTSDGVELYYERQGHGPRVYACPGGPANDHRYLAEDLEPLADDHEVVCVDYRGSGHSASASTGSYLIERFADDLDELRRELGDDRIAVIGHSMGSFVALAYAVRHPQHCERIILVGSFPAVAPRLMLPPTLRALGWARSVTMAARAVWWIGAWSWRRRTSERRRRLYGVWATTQEGLANVRANERDRERRLGLPLENDNIRFVQRQLQRLDFTADLPSIACPALILYGTRDAAAVAGAPRFEQGLREVDVIALPDVGHDPLFEAPTESFEAIRPFLGPSSDWPRSAGRAGS